MAVEVEAKVASADAFAEKVGIEKEKVNAENEAAKVRHHWPHYFDQDSRIAGYRVLLFAHTKQFLLMLRVL